MARRKANDEGTIYLRKDGRYEASAYLLTTGGTRKRKSFYGKTRKEVHDKLIAAKMHEQQGIAIHEEATKLGDYLDYWLEQIIRPIRRATTHDLYESNIRLYLKPGLGHHLLTRLNVQTLQQYLNRQLADGHSIRKVEILREVLSSALTWAMREERISKNFAKLVVLPTRYKKRVRPWTIDETTRFLEITKSHWLYPAFVLLVLYGLRRGEVLGLRWCDVDFEASEIHIQQQVNRAHGVVQQGPVKTEAGLRDLPLLGFVRQVLLQQREQCQLDGSTGLIFKAQKSSRPVEPQVFSRSFQRVCEQHGIRRIKLHHVRHTNATLLKNLGVPAKDAQLILGHSNVSVTQDIYQHDDMDTRREALGRVEKVLLNIQNDDQDVESGRPILAHCRQIGLRCRQKLPSNPSFMDRLMQSMWLKNIPTPEVAGASMGGNFLGDPAGSRTPVARMKTWRPNR